MYLNTLDCKSGFTVRDLLADKSVTLNISPFMEGRQQMTAKEIQCGQQISALYIHVERVMGCIKNYAILKGNQPITMIPLTNQIVSMCAWLTNFQPALIPLPS